MCGWVGGWVGGPFASGCHTQLCSSWRRATHRPRLRAARQPQAAATACHPPAAPCARRASSAASAAASAGCAARCAAVMGGGGSAAPLAPWAPLLLLALRRVLGCRLEGMRAALPTSELRTSISCRINGRRCWCCRSARAPKRGAGWLGASRAAAARRTAVRSGSALPGCLGRGWRGAQCRTEGGLVLCSMRRTTSSPKPGPLSLRAAGRGQGRPGGRPPGWNPVEVQNKQPAALFASQRGTTGASSSSSSGSTGSSSSSGRRSSRSRGGGGAPRTPRC